MLSHHQIKQVSTALDDLSFLERFKKLIKIYNKIKLKVMQTSFKKRLLIEFLLIRF